MVFKSIKNIKKEINNLSENIKNYINKKYNKNINIENIIELIKINSSYKLCKYKDCLKNSSYGDKIPQYCFKHKNKDNINFKDKRQCKFKNCGKKPSFAKPPNKKGEYCNLHKPSDEYINIKSRLCKCCSKQASYGLKNSIMEYCNDHKPNDDYLNLKGNFCQTCGKIASYSKPNSNILEYCKLHKPKNYINKRTYRCLTCGIVASFGKIGTKKSLYCEEHKPDNSYINLRKTECKYCNKTASYGKIGSKTSLYCEEHKPDNSYINLRKTECKYCNKQANFSKIGSKIKEYCSEHKEEGYINLKIKLCKFDKCKKYAIYAKINTKKPLYCRNHKTEDCIIILKLCNFENCDKLAICGKLFQDKIHCIAHKENNEYRYNLPKCIIDECKNQPIFTDKNNNYPLRCEYHKLNNDIDIINRKCNNCGLEDFIKTGNVCNDCINFKKYSKNKEIEIKNILLANNINYTTYDKIIKDGCSLYRPDFVFDLGDRIIVLEVDENQHKSYLCECEQKRMIQIHQDYGGLDVCFIRYNPDNYKNKNNKIIKNDIGRHNKLLDTINNLTLYRPQYNLSVIYMYYDGYDGNNKIEPIKY